MLSLFSLPFIPGTRKLSLETLNKHSTFRKPERGYMHIHVREISFANELLTLSVKLNDEPEEKVYLKITETALLVSCSVDTDESYLSRYAYFALLNLIKYPYEHDFERWYWPGCFDPITGRSKIVMLRKIRNKMSCLLKKAYAGLIKPGQHLPILSDEDTITRPAAPVKYERIPAEEDPILGFALAFTHTGNRYNGHVPFLVPYLGIANKARTAIKGFHSYIVSDKDLFLQDLSDEQQKLVDLCLEMRKHTVLKSISSLDHQEEFEVKRDYNRQVFIKMFNLWQQAMPILVGRLYTHYQYSYGMRYLKGKPYRDRMSKGVFSNETPELCFIWKDHGDHYKIELRFKIDKQIWKPSFEFNVIFFANTQKNPTVFYLLKTYMDSLLVSFFHKDNFQIIILKEQYDGRIKEFVDQLRSRYKFIER